MASASPLRFHVLYFEQALRLGESDHGPRHCDACTGVANPWLGRWDNLQTTLRMCGKEETGFRREVTDFTCFSPSLRVSYQLRLFYQHLSEVGSKAFTEESIIGAALRAHASEILEHCGTTQRRSAAGVDTEVFEGSEWEQGLQDYFASLRASAEADGGLAACILLDRDSGVELSPLTLTGHSAGFWGGPAFGDACLSDILLLLGGPNGFGDQLSNILARVQDGERGLHRLLRLRLPGGRQHSYVALGEVLGWHDRRQLLPALYDLLALGSQQYAQCADVAAAEVRRVLRAAAEHCRTNGGLAPPKRGTDRSAPLRERFQVALGRLSEEDAEDKLRVGPQVIQQEVSAVVLGSSAAAPGQPSSHGALPDEEVARLLEQEVLRHGGKVNCNMIYHANPKLRKLVGDRKLLQFLRCFPSLFVLEKTLAGTDVVRTFRVSAFQEPAAAGMTLPGEASQLGRRAMRELEAALVQQLVAWRSKPYGHDSPFMPQVARDGKVRRKLQAFIRYCPVAALMLHKMSSEPEAPAPEAGGKAADGRIHRVAGEELHMALERYARRAARTRGLETAEAAEGNTWWVAQFLHLRLFLLDRQELFHVFDSEKVCDKGFQHCCCHLKIKLQDGAESRFQSTAAALDQPVQTAGKSERKLAKERRKERLKQQAAAINCGAHEKGECKAEKPTLKRLQLVYLQQHRDYVVVDKPPHLRTEAIFETLQAEADEEGRGRIVEGCSRLDKNTSGCLLVPLHDESCRLWTLQFAEHRMSKTYWALVWGSLPEAGNIDAKLYMVENNTKYRAFVSPKGKPALTRYRVLRRYVAPTLVQTAGECTELTLVECQPVTGRTHQIRAHFEHIGRRLVSDTKYGKMAGVRDCDWCPRMFLHCHRLAGEFSHGGFDVESVLPSDLQLVLDQLEEVQQ